MPVSLDRRAFLARAGLASASAVALTAVGARPAARADTSLEPFPYGVASGDPLADRVVLWTRLTPAAPSAVTPVTWRVYADADRTVEVASGRVTTDASRDHTVKVDVAGLDPATTYHYDFAAPDGRRSLLGRTRTAPAGPTDRLRFGVASCANYEGGYFNAYARLAERDDLDAVLHLGDYLYEYGNDEYGPGSGIGRSHQPPVEMVTLAQYRARHAHYKLDPDLRRLHQRVPFITTWDDHEITNDAWSGGAENHQPDEGDYEQRKRHAARAYAEWMPIRLPDPDDPVRIYRSFAFGDLVDVLVLDTRIDGRDQQVGGVLEPGNALAPDLESEDRRMISEEQRTWLRDGLEASTARWRLLAQQVMMMPWRIAGTPAFPDGAPDAPLVTSEGIPVNADAWDGYPAERDRVLGHLEQAGVGNVVVLTGDIHSSWAADLPRDPFDPTRYDPLTGAGSVAVEFVCPSVTSASFNKTLGYHPAPSTELEVASRAANPHIKYTEFDSHGYVLLDVTPERVQAQWWHAHDVFEPHDGHALHAAWEVRDGQPHVVESSDVATAEATSAPPPAATPTPEPSRVLAAAAGVDGDAGGSLPATGGGSVTAAIAALTAAGVLHLRSRRMPPAR